MTFKELPTFHNFLYNDTLCSKMNNSGKYNNAVILDEEGRSTDWTFIKPNQDIIVCKESVS